MKKILFLSAAFFISLTVYPQKTATLSGVVYETDEHGHKSPLLGVNLVWVGTTTGATSDEGGKFNLKRVDGTNLLAVSYVGYSQDTIQVKNKNYIEIELNQVISLDEVSVVFREKSTTIDYLNPINAHTMHEDELFKAACCNLSESFETNPSVDVSFTDAVTGRKQIEMLGLAGIYTQTTVENMPLMRGLAAIEGLTYIPGAWMNSIQVTKGAGSVINGYESIAGQINVQIKSPEESERLYANMYLNEGGRTEMNLNVARKISDVWSSALLLHTAVRPFEIDKNNDAFVDHPSGSNLMALNRWNFRTKSWEGQFGLKTIFSSDEAGQAKKFLEDQQDPYKVNLNTERVELWGKTGYVFPAKPYQSFGLQLAGVFHDQENLFGANTWKGNERSLYANLIFQSIIGNTAHQYKAGISYIVDDYKEDLNDLTFDRTEQAPGAFVEYSYNSLNEKLNMVAGLRADHHNFHGLTILPRLHTRFGVSETASIRASFGRGFRTANVIAENFGAMVSSRTLEIIPSGEKGAYGLDPEIAWNMGVNFTQEFRMNYRDGSFAVDFYRTSFDKQVIVDRDTDPGKIMVYNLDGKSYSNSFQAELNYEILKMLDMRMAYRWYDVNTTYSGVLMQRPLLARDRAFLNLAYEGLKNWNLDYTLQWIGAKRLPDVSANPEEYQTPAQSPHFSLMNAQVTRKLKKLEVYLGMENILDFRQDNPIMSSDNPWGPYFDSASIWGPVFGRMTYLGARFKLD